MAVTRRGLLGAATASGAALATGAFPGGAVAKPAPYKENKRIDMHAHHLPPAYLAALHDAGITLLNQLPIPEWTPETALAFMDSHGIAVQMLSISDPGVTFVSDSDAPGLASECNDYVASVVAQYPDRFGSIAVLPTRDLDASRAEIIRSLDVLGLDGVGLLSNTDGRYLGDPVFEPLLGELDARKAWVFVHPTVPPADDRPDYAIPAFVAEFPFDTTRTIISLLFNGSFHRYPNIRWQFAHGGGTISMLRPRLEALGAAAQQFGPFLGLPTGSSVLKAKSATWALHRAFYDTALVADPPALESVAALAHTPKMLFGSDWPFAARLYEPEGDPQPALSKVFGADERRAIDRLNARAQFSRLAQAIPGR